MSAKEFSLFIGNHLRTYLHFQRSTRKEESSFHCIVQNGHNQQEVIEISETNFYIKHIKNINKSLPLNQSIYDE